MLFLVRNAAHWFGAAAAFLLTFLIVLGVASGRPQQAGGESKDKPAGKSAPSVQPAPSQPPPLELDEEPLRLDSLEKPGSLAAAKKTADNGACLVCHANFRKESLAATHASNSVSCSSCHGPSNAHRNDEANVIPPDHMFAAESIDSSCARCHAGHDVEPRAVVQRFLEKSSNQTDMKSLVCTSCHGEHRMAVRTVRWDRKTGKLVATGK